MVGKINRIRPTAEHIPKMVNSIMLTNTQLEAGVMICREKEFLENLIKGKINEYSYHYKRVLKKRILDKRKDLTDNLHLISLAEDKLQAL